MKSLKHLNKYFFKYKWRLMLGFVFIIGSNALGTYSPVIIKDVVDFANSVVGEGEKSESLPLTVDYLNQWFNLGLGANSENVLPLTKIILYLCLFYIFIFLGKGLFSFLTRQTIIVMSRLIEFDLKNEIYQQYQSLDLGFFKRNNTGDLMNRISEDVSKVRMYLGPAVMYTLNLFVQIFLVVGFMLYYSVELTIWSLTPLPFMSYAIFKVSSMIHNKSEEVQEQQSTLSSMTQETFSGIRTLKTYNREKSQSNRFQKESDLYKMKSLDLVKIEALFMPIIVLLVGLSNILTIYIGGTKVMAGELLLGDVFAFIFWVNMLTWPFASVGWITSLVQKAAASQKRINEFLNESPEIVNPSQAPLDLKGEIEFKNVRFAYPGANEESLKGIDFKIDAGKSLAIIGRTGSGKSTIANLLCRLYDPSEGEILIDGKNLDSLNLNEYRENLGYVPQDVFLFSEDISSNIAFGISQASEDLIREAAKDADLHDNIMEFQNQYETLLGERGINLSGGQKQRLSIARAIIKDPGILIFDDCLSAVDTQTEEKILNSLKRRMKGSTSIIISHRISSIKNADEIIMIDQGKVIERGTHEKLLNDKGAYFSLYQKQLIEAEE